MRLQLVAAIGGPTGRSDDGDDDHDDDDGGAGGGRNRLVGRSRWWWRRRRRQKILRGVGSRSKRCRRPTRPAPAGRIEAHRRGRMRLEKLRHVGGAHQATAAKSRRSTANGWRRRDRSSPLAACSRRADVTRNWRHESTLALEDQHTDYYKTASHRVCSHYGCKMNIELTT